MQWTSLDIQFCQKVSRLEKEYATEQDGIYLGIFFTKMKKSYCFMEIMNESKYMVIACMF